MSLMAPTFADKDCIAEWAKKEINFVYLKKIIKGVGENKIDPMGNTTREQAIVLLKRTYETFSKGNASNVSVSPTAIPSRTTI